MIYPVIVHKDKKSDFGVTVPDLPGCFSSGSTYEEALMNVQEAILCHIEGLLLDGENIPAPSDVELHVENPDYQSGTWALVSVDLSKISGKAKRINVTIPENILSKIDSYAKTHGESRSGLFATAAMEYMLNNTNN